ncbi:retrovirus-related pol polyprotein from transposon TNT 1-94 [Tanacetum coccineum]
MIYGLRRETDISPPRPIYRLKVVDRRDICEPFINDIGGHKYFITFVDDYSCYAYVYLIKEKSESLDVFKFFKEEVKNQLNRKIKIVISNRGGEYYGKYSDLGQSPGPFALYCQEKGIIEALKIVTHILNSVHSKSVLKTSFELWTGWAPSLRYFKIWGFPAEAKKFNPQTKKLDSRTISCYFIGYPERSKGYQFYCPNHTTRIIETRDVEFIENGEISRNGERSIDLNEKLMDDPNQELSIPLYMENSTTVTSDQVVYIPIIDAPPHNENPNPAIIQ